MINIIKSLLIWLLKLKKKKLYYITMNTVLQVSDIANIIDNIIPNVEYTIMGEVSKPRVFGGNMYFNFKDNYSNINAMLPRRYIMKNITDGDKIVCNGIMSYYKPKGSLTFKISNIISIEGVGEIYKQYNDYMLKCKSKGYFDKTKAILPKPITNILILTSKNGAAVQDFIYNINRNRSLLKYEIVDVPVQGLKCPSKIISVLKNKENLKDYDFILLTRGGGSFEDLLGFSNPKLIKYIYNLKYPIMSAIGHNVDNPLLDKVADYVAPTPSLAGQFIIDHNNKYMSELNQILFLAKEKIKYMIENKKNKLEKLQKDLSINSLFLENMLNFLKENIINSINKEYTRINKLQEKLKEMSNISNTNDINILFGKKKCFRYKKINKKLKNNKPITILINNIKVVLTDYEYTIKENL